jgi:hypothetical protein
MEAAYINIRNLTLSALLVQPDPVQPDYTRTRKQTACQLCWRDVCRRSIAG